MFRESDGKIGISLATGEKLEEIVDKVFATTKEANLKANPKSDPDKMNQPQIGGDIAKIVNLSCETRIIAYNEKNNEYVRKFVYYINLYDIPRALTEEPKSGSDQQSRIQYLIQDSLKKKYAYVYTGDNTEVLNLDLNFNNLWRFASTLS